MPVDPVQLTLWFVPEMFESRTTTALPIPSPPSPTDPAAVRFVKVEDEALAKYTPSGNEPAAVAVTFANVGAFGVPYVQIAVL